MEPWIIQKYSDHFQIYERLEKKPPEVENNEFPLTPDECFEPECPECETNTSTINDTYIAGGSPVEVPEVKSDLDQLREDLEEFKAEFAKVSKVVAQHFIEKTTPVKPKTIRKKAPAKK